MNISNCDIELLTHRENTYRLLSQLYNIEPTEAFYSKLKSIDFEILNDTGFGEGYRLIKSFINEDREDPITDLAVDYARVFLGAGVVEKHKAANPYESVYTSKERLVMQDARDKVVAIYRKNGLDKIETLHVPEDHISIELEFMAALCRKMLETGECTLRVQKAFITEHLLNWVPEFCDDILKYAKTDFYKGVAAFTLDFLKADLQLIDEIILEN